MGRVVVELATPKEPQARTQRALTGSPAPRSRRGTTFEPRRPPSGLGGGPERPGQRFAGRAYLPGRARSGGSLRERRRRRTGEAGSSSVRRGSLAPHRLGLGGPDPGGPFRRPQPVGKPTAPCGSAPAVSPAGPSLERVLQRLAGRRMASDRSCATGVRLGRAVGGRIGRQHGPGRETAVGGPDPGRSNRDVPTAEAPRFEPRSARGDDCLPWPAPCLERRRRGEPPGPGELRRHAVRDVARLSCDASRAVRVC